MPVREQLFAEAYLANGGVGKAAAIAAGYAESNASAQAVKMLNRPSVKLMIRERQDALAKTHRLTTDSVIAELSKIVHADPRRAFDDNGALLQVKDWPDDLAGAIASVEVEELFTGAGKDRTWIGYTKKVKFWDKNSAIDKAMKHLGLFAEDNKQRLGALSDLPREVLQLIVAKLQQQTGGKVIDGQYTRA
jgi:phage terminase small subunit